MSTKSTIFLTDDNEHCYRDGGETIFGIEGDLLGPPIYIEFDKSNIEIVKNDDSDLIIKLTYPPSEIYQKIRSLQE